MENKQQVYICHRNGYAVVKASGENILTYLQGQMTQDVKLMSSGQAIYAAVLNHQSKAITDFYVLPTRGDEVMFVCPAALAVTLVERLRSFALGYQLRIGVVSSFKVISLQGQGVNDYWQAAGLPVPSQASLAVAHSADIAVMRLPEAADDGVWCMLPAASMSSALLANTDEQDIITRRIIKGVPSFGVDWDEKIHPLNANLIERNGVSFDKGCYVGQEVTSRMHWRGGIKKKLYRVSLMREGFDGEGVVLPIPILTTVKVGELTSVADSKDGLFGIALLPISVVDAATPLKLEDGTEVKVLGICE